MAWRQGRCRWCRRIQGQEARDAHSVDFFPRARVGVYFDLSNQEISRDADQKSRAANGRIGARENRRALTCRVEDLHACDEWCAERLKDLDGRCVHGAGEPREKPLCPPSLGIGRPRQAIVFAAWSDIACACGLRC